MLSAHGGIRVGPIGDGGPAFVALGIGWPPTIGDHRHPTVVSGIGGILGAVFVDDLGLALGTQEACFVMAVRRNVNGRHGVRFCRRA